MFFGWLQAWKHCSDQIQWISGRGNVQCVQSQHFGLLWGRKTAAKMFHFIHLSVPCSISKQYDPNKILLTNVCFIFFIPPLDKKSYLFLKSSTPNQSNTIFSFQVEYSQLCSFFLYTGLQMSPMTYKMRYGRPPLSTYSRSLSTLSKLTRHS